MISSTEMLEKLIVLTEKKKQRSLKKNLTVVYDDNKLKEIINEVEQRIHNDLNFFVGNEVNCTKKASAFELILRCEMPLSYQESTNKEKQINLNAQYAMSFATFLLFDTSALFLDTRQAMTVDEPFHKSLTNHLIWLKKVELHKTRLPIFLNAAYWDLIQLIYNNRHNFINV